MSFSAQIGINHYLEHSTIKIPATYPGQPVTLQHILTHTAGFDEVPFNAAVRSANELVPLGDFLSTFPITRVRPPGQVSSYDNVGFALAGYVVEIVSGQSFASYIHDHILRPLGMTNTSFFQPASPAIEANLARGYYPDGQQQILTTRKYSSLTPMGAGPMATAHDMGQLMLAYLHQGRLGTTRILGEAATQELLRNHFSNDDRLQGLAYGFEEYTRHGQQMLSKDGDFSGFSCNLVLLPEQGIGIYVAYNGTGSNGGGTVARRELIDRFIDSFYPASILPHEPAIKDTQVSRFAGIYRNARYSHTNFSKLTTLLSYVTVHVNEDGTLATTGLALDPKQPSQRWIQRAPGLFQEQDGPNAIAFGQDAQGTVSTLFLSWDKPVTFERLAWYQSPPLHLALLAGSFLLLAGATVIWPAIALVRRRQLSSPHTHLKRRGMRGAQWLGWTVSLLTVVFVSGLMGFLSDRNAFVETVLFGVPPLLSIILTLPLLTTILAIGMLGVCIVTWIKQWWSWPERLGYTLVSVAALLFFFIAAQYQLVGWPIF